MNYFHIAYQPSVIIRIPSAADAAKSEGFPSFFVEMNGKKLIVDVQEPIAISTAITVECDDAMFLGEVVATTQQNGRFHVEIAVEQVLSGLQSLMALRNQLLGDSAPAVRPEKAVGQFQTV